MKVPALFAVIGLVVSLAASLPIHANAQVVSPDEARAIAKQATIYGFPLTWSACIGPARKS